MILLRLLGIGAVYVGFMFVKSLFPELSYS